jgi:hypothetical protein
MNIFDANPKICQFSTDDHGMLLYSEKSISTVISLIAGRCKKRSYFARSPQWFISMDDAMRFSDLRIWEFRILLWHKEKDSATTNIRKIRNSVNPQIRHRYRQTSH